MFERLLAFIQNPTKYETPLPPADAAHVVGALMVQAAKADRAYLFEEVEVIDRVLARRHNLNPVEAAKMRAQCEKLEEHMHDTDALAGILKEAVGTEEAEAALRALWAVVFADGFEQEEEDNILHQVEAVLGISPLRAKELHDEEMQNAQPDELSTL
ncbi:TerB family tellurite resistance protein [Ascidiaceihabitans sp.]|uniref:tellurite resistance TerB family protein n=1 Tax=Ascidiaceihabitans sp. TaxID=1872644 RepID=UPI00329964B9